MCISLCVCAGMSTCGMSVCVCIICLRIRVSVCICMYVYAGVSVCICVCVCMSVCLHICVCKCACIGPFSRSSFWTPGEENFGILALECGRRRKTASADGKVLEIWIFRSLGRAVPRTASPTF